MPDSDEILDNFWDDEEGNNVLLDDENTTKSSVEEKDPEEKVEEKKRIDEVANIFDSEEDEEEIEDTSTSNTKLENEPEENAGDFQSVLKTLGESGFLKIGEDEEITTENASDIFETKMEENLESRLEEILSDLPDEIKTLNKYVLNGGDPSEFLKVSAKPTASLGSLELETEENQMVLAKRALQDEGFDDELIEAQLEFLKDAKQLQKYATTKQKNYKDAENKEKEELLAIQQRRAVEEKEATKQMKNSINDIVKKEGSLKGFNISAKEKKELPSYIADKSIKLEGGGRISEFQKGLLESLKDPEKMTLLAKLVKNDFDFTDIVNKSKTAISKEIKKGVRRTSTIDKGTKSILDYLK